MDHADLQRLILTVTNAPAAYLAQLPMPLDDGLPAWCVGAEAIARVPRHKVDEEVTVQRGAHIRHTEAVRSLHRVSKQPALLSCYAS